LLRRVCLISQHRKAHLSLQLRQVSSATMVLGELQLHSNQSYQKCTEVRLLEHLAHEQQCLQFIVTMSVKSANLEHM
jgi:hypothetical protein